MEIQKRAGDNQNVYKIPDYRLFAQKIEHKHHCNLIAHIKQIGGDQNAYQQHPLDHRLVGEAVDYAQREKAGKKPEQNVLVNKRKHRAVVHQIPRNLGNKRENKQHRAVSESVSGVPKALRYQKTKIGKDIFPIISIIQNREMLTPLTEKNDIVLSSL